MTEFKRRNSRPVKVGALTLGGGSHISVQSMTNTDTSNIAATLAQVRSLEAAGCDIVRLAVPTVAAARTFFSLKNAGVAVPLVADIHFDYRIALACAESGADKIRINPGNIGSKEKIKAVADACRQRGIPIRIGVNSGSLERDILEKYGHPSAEAICESALRHADLLEQLDFTDIVISVKSSDVLTCIQTNRLLAERTDYPLHLGVTESGSAARGSIKSAVGIGALLAEGIGDTVRVSLTADPVKEVAAAREILGALHLTPPQMMIVSCPTCGRTKIDLIPLLSEFERKIDELGLRKIPLKVAFMGCAVNGPGEAREADIGIAGGVGEALLFSHGEPVAKYPADKVVDVLIDAITEMAKENIG